MSQHHSAGSDSSPRTTVVHALLIVAAGLVAYSTSFAGVFVFDDIREIVDEERVHSLTPLTSHLFNFRPLVSLSLAINWAIGGDDPFGYHVFNFAVHACAALVLYGLVRRTLALPRLRSVSRSFAPESLALAVALLWVVHPLGTQAVTYVVQRAESMMALFYLLVLYCVVRAATSTGPLWKIAAVVACAAGMGSKAVMVTAPVTALVFDALCVGGSLRAAWRARWPMYAGLFGMWILVLVTGRAAGVLAIGGSDASVGFALRDVSPLEYLLSQPGVLLHYLRLVLVPYPQTLDYRWPVATGFFAIALPALLVGALLVVTIRGWVRGRAWAFLGVAFFLVLLPTSSVVPIADLANEHRMYLPLAAVLTALVLGVVALLERRRPEHVRTASLALLAVAAVAFTATTAVRNRVYHTNLALWQDVADARPDNPRAFANLSTYLAAEGRLEESLATAERAVALAPQAVEAWRALATAQNRLDRYADAVASLREALALQPGDPNLQHELGVALEDLGLFRDAIAAYEEALAHDGRRADTLDALAQLAGKTGDSERAIALLRRAVAVAPRDAELRQHLGIVLADAERYDDAIRVLREAVVLQPDSSAIRFALGRAIEAAGRNDEAVEIYREIADDDAASRAVAFQRINILRTRERLEERAADRSALESGQPEQLVVLARALVDLDRFEEALAVQRQYVVARTEEAEGWVLLGDIYLGLGRNSEAYGAYSRAERLDPHNKLAVCGKGIAAVKLGDAKEGGQDLEAVLKADPTLFDAQVHLGIAYLEQKRTEDALQRFGAATLLRPASSDARSRLAEVMQAVGRLDEAIVEYRRALRANPKNLEVREALERAVKRQMKKP